MRAVSALPCLCRGSAAAAAAAAALVLYNSGRWGSLFLRNYGLSWRGLLTHDAHVVTIAMGGPGSDFMVPDALHHWSFLYFVVGEVRSWLRGVALKGFLEVEFSGD